jgi:hypothetical protein
MYLLFAVDSSVASLVVLWSSGCAGFPAYSHLAAAAPAFTAARKETARRSIGQNRANHEFAAAAAYHASTISAGGACRFF